MPGVGVALVLVGLLLSHRGLDRIEQCLSSGCHSKIPGTGATDIIPQSSGGCEVQEPDAGWFHSWEWLSSWLAEPLLTASSHGREKELWPLFLFL